jgi:hypothetical protein
MAIKFNETYIDNIARGHLEPGEQIVARSAGVHRPWWSLGLWLFSRTYLVIATNRRILLAEHRRGLVYDRLEKVEAVPFGEISKAALSGLLLKKKLHLAFLNGRRTIAIVLTGLFGPIANSVAGAKKIVASWSQGKTLPVRTSASPAHAMVS